jgi:hypothetical protein
MKNLLLPLLLIPTILLGQTNIKKHSLHYTGNGVPVGYSKFVGISTNCTYKDLTTSTTYLYKGNSVWEVNESVYPVVKGDKGDQGIQGLQGERGQVGIQGVQGQQGIQGVAGQNGVCPSCPPNNNVTFTFGATYVFTNGVDDAPAIQRAVDTAYVTGKRIYLVGNLHFRSTGVKIPKDIQHLNIEGYATLWADIDAPFSYFYSDMPVDVTQAESVYTNRRISIKYLVFRGFNSGVNQKQTATDLHAQEGGEYANLWGYNLKTFLNLTFALRTTVTSCEANACIDGLIVQPGTDRYSNTPYKEAASNGVDITDFRVYGGPMTNIGVKIKDASLVGINGLVLEGGYMNIGLEYIAISSSSTPLVASRIHFEATNRCGIAAIRITSSTMTHVLDQLNLVKPSILVEVVAYGGGYPNVLITNVSNQRVLFDDVNPILKSSIGVGWKFDNCDHPFVAYKMPKIFTGATMTNSCVRENGLSRWCIVNPPN